MACFLLYFTPRRRFDRKCCRPCLWWLRKVAVSASAYQGESECFSMFQGRNCFFFSNDCTIGIIFNVSTMDLKARVYWMSLVASALLNMVFASASVTLATGGMPWTSMLSSHAVYFRNLQTRLMHIHVSKQLATKSYYINLS